MQTDVNDRLCMNIQTAPTNTQFKPVLDRNMFATTFDNKFLNHPSRHTGTLQVLSIAQKHDPEDENAYTSWVHSH